MGQEIQRLGLWPDLVLCSTAVRARNTWDLIFPILEPKPAVEYFASLYLASANGILEQVRNCHESISRVLMVGHNPGLEALAIHLAGKGSDAQALLVMKTKFPTAALAEIWSDAPDWRRFDHENARLKRFLRPADLTR